MRAALPLGEQSREEQLRSALSPITRFADECLRIIAALLRRLDWPSRWDVSSQRRLRKRTRCAYSINTATQVQSQSLTRVTLPTYWQITLTAKRRSGQEFVTSASAQTRSGSRAFS